MAEWLAAIEQLSLARALRASFVAYPLVNALHIASVGILLASLLFLHGRAAGLFPAFASSSSETTFRRAAIAAFAVAALSGFALFSIRASEYALNPAFRIKLALLALAGVNLALYLALPRWRIPGSIASALFWPAILVAGRFIGFVAG
jgi:hypothetical protein